MLFYTEPTLDAGMIMNTGRGPGDLGNIDDCLGMAPSAHYCVYQSTINVPDYGLYTYVIGLCVPSSCNTTEDLSAAILEMLAVQVVFAYPGNETVSHCYNSYDNITVKSWTTGAKVMVGVCTFFGLMMAIGTIVEYLSIKYPRGFKKSDETEALLDGFGMIRENGSGEPVNEQQPLGERSKFAAVFLAFSLISNYRSFTQGASSNRRFDALDGIRTLSTCWVLLGHSLLFSAQLGIDNISYVFTDVRQLFTFQALPAGEFAVDIFFMLSGFLVAHTVLVQLDKREESGKGSGLLFWLQYVVHRLLRLSPLYYFLLFVLWQLSPMFGSGPLWYQYNVSSSCDQYWWTNLLYINNMYPATLDQECMGWSWYLANDMQFYLLAPFVLLAYRKFKPAGWLMIVALLAVCFTTNIWITIKFHLATFFDLSPQVTDFTTDIYSKPWTRVGPFAVGLAVALLYRIEKTRELYNKPLFRYTAYILALSITFFFTYIPYTSFHSDNGWNNTENGLYNGFAHTLFTVGLALYMMSTFYGHGGVLGQFLELPIFKYFSKLTYSTYLIHPIVIFTGLFSRTTFTHYSPTEFAWMYTGNTVLSFAAAFVVHLAVEKPFVNLERLILPSRRQSSSRPYDHNKDIN
ncbi:hypothetical protein SAMD00019534_038950 [Acytostelium subglobosum LB1]|uniref:hypothetical protein n=1 Tax=Acytostelium subglobosum LB1 TaxID=1410327 RepID=UPI000644B50D|nr:hypothetical protein SAMD00019534_038950 [Acytostelium subglobosum LB1]GAM20720.1 hypothetical protein SAMD00019534_038950 [Acytostelium subglobosum LB1]|eukprot:XP_012755854.1 hypothetical protein SAMD00019534_038950 [Acytostelium subglobosum LB1]